jgi:hypothetical protein
MKTKRVFARILVLPDADCNNPLDSKSCAAKGDEVRATKCRNSPVSAISQNSNEGGGYFRNPTPLKGVASGVGCYDEAVIR